MMNRISSMALLLLAGCTADPESGIDRTFIRGTVLLPPGEFAEAETETEDNNDTKTAQDLGYITTRYTVVTGDCDGFGILKDEPIGTPDTYSFSPTQSGALNLYLDFVGSEYVDKKSQDRSWYFVSVFDEDGNVLVESTTEGSFGAYATAFTVESGMTYFVQLTGGQNRDDSDGSYTLTIDGFNPNGVLVSTGEALEAGWTIQDGEMYSQAPTDFLIGAYQSNDVTARGLPLGGSDVPTFELDPETLTWAGEYEITYVYAATLPEDVDTGGFVSPVVETGLGEVHLFSGTFPSLNAGLTAGTFYSSTPLTVDLNSATAEEYEAGFFGVASTNRSIQADDLICDLIQPKQYGWAEVDTEPNDFADAGDGYSIVDTAGAQELPVASGAGFIDTITGSLEFTDAAPSWAGDHDAFMVTVPSDLNAFLSLAWGNPTFDLDLHLYDSTGALVGAGWAIANSNPEEFSVTDFSDPLLPGETYYIAVLPWSGEVGTIDYTIEVEWLAP